LLHRLSFLYRIIGWKDIAMEFKFQPINHFF
jgi:hypothetical protein